MKISSCPNGTEPSARARIAAPNAMPPPRMRQSSGRRSLVSDRISSTPMTETAGTTSPRRKTVSRASMLASQPDSPATARMPNESAKRPITWTMPSSARTSSSGTGIAGAVATGNDLGRHRIGDHVLDDGADHDQHRPENIEVIRAGERDPSAGGAGERQHPGGGGGGADEDVSLALRAEDGNAVDQFAEHHLDGPWQAEPHRDPGQLGRAQRQPLLDPHVAADVDQSQRAIGEIDHRQRQVGQAEAPDRPQQRRQPQQAVRLDRRLRVLGERRWAQRLVHATASVRGRACSGCEIVVEHQFTSAKAGAAATYPSIVRNSRGVAVATDCAKTARRDDRQTSPGSARAHSSFSALKIRVEPVREFDKMPGLGDRNRVPSLWVGRRGLQQMTSSQTRNDLTPPQGCAARGSRRHQTLSCPHLLRSGIEP